LNTFLDHPRGVSRHQAIGRHILHDDARHRDNAVVPDSYPRHDDAVRADLTFLADPGVQVKPPRLVVGENAGAEVYRCTLADMNADRVAFVQFGRKRDPSVGPDIHSPQLIEIKAAQFAEERAKLAAHNRQEAGRAQVGKPHGRSPSVDARRNALTLPWAAPFDVSLLEKLMFCV